MVTGVSLGQGSVKVRTLKGLNGFCNREAFGVPNRSSSSGAVGAGAAPERKDRVRSRR